MMSRPLKEFLLCPFSRFYTLLAHLCKLIEKKLKNCLNFSFHRYQEFSKFPTNKTQKRVKHHKNLQQDDMFKPSITNTLNFRQF